MKKILAISLLVFGLMAGATAPSFASGGPPSNAPPSDSKGG